MSFPTLLEALRELKDYFSIIRINKSDFLPSSQENIEEVRKLVYDFGQQVKHDFLTERKDIPFDTYERTIQYIMIQLDWIVEFERVD